jgi:two-component system chemotaxis response regulator CheB
MSPSREIKVLIVDDSAVVRQVMAQVLGQDPEIRIVAHAIDPLFAMEKMKKNGPT